MDAREYENPYFQSQGFRRQVCQGCGEPFWSRTPRERCAEVPCTGGYTFIDASPFGKPLDLHQMREAFLGFLAERGHTRIRRYPVVPRWRDDVMFVQASIYDFQPWVTSGAIEPPANPLAISQPCLRFTDVANVGLTGRHLTGFEMMAHHAFNRPDHVLYWKDRTVELCDEFLSSSMGCDPNEVTYKEEEWAGGGNSGPSLSVGVRGLEIATLVFMQYVGPAAERRPMPLTVVDTGYGLERWTWVAQGSPTIYDAIFAPVFRDLPHGFSPEEQALLVDHAKSFAFLFTDGVIPSNVREGYLARMLLRRMLRVLGRHPGALALPGLLDTVIRHWSGEFPELAANRKGLHALLDLEQQRFEEALARGRTEVKRLEERRAREGRAVVVDDLVELYDSLGITPDAAVEQLAKPVEVPPDFFARVAARHEVPVSPEAPGGHATSEVPTPPPELPGTEVLYYTDPYTSEFEATVVWVQGPWVALDRTFLYPTGGGQVHDEGTIAGRPVVDIVRTGAWVLHKLGPGDGGALSVGRRVSATIDRTRRRQLMQHHTGTHLLNGALRRVLGDHVWQAGAFKGIDGARLDVTHYKALSPEELTEVERLVNSVIWEDRPVRSYFLPRGEAEHKFGFGLYQGGAVPGKTLRIVEVTDFDVEACGGTHCTRTGEVGLVKVLSTERIQDGMLRLNFAAGDRALGVLQERQSLLDEAARKLAAPVDGIPQALDKLLERVKEAQRGAKALLASDLRGLAESLRATPASYRELPGKERHAVVARVAVGRDDLKELARLLTAVPGTVALLATELPGGEAAVFFASGDPKGLPARSLLESALATWPGKGGGNPSAAQASGPWSEKVLDALEAAFGRAKELAAGSG